MGKLGAQLKGDDSDKKHNDKNAKKEGLKKQPPKCPQAAFLGIPQGIKPGRTSLTGLDEVLLFYLLPGFARRHAQIAAKQGSTGADFIGNTAGSPPD